MSRNLNIYQAVLERIFKCT